MEHKKLLIRRRRIKYPSGISDLHDLMVEGLGNYVSKASSKINMMT